MEGTNLYKVKVYLATSLTNEFLSHSSNMAREFHFIQLLLNYCTV